MATALYLTSTGSDAAAGNLAAAFARGSSLATSVTNTALGPIGVPGITATQTAGGTQLAWYTPRLSAVTISGTITMNLWVAESNMSANATSELSVWRADQDGIALALVSHQEFGTEMAVTTRAAQNWTTTPSSTTINDGERILIIVYWNDATATTMASGFTVSMGYSGPTAAADGDSFVSFVETITTYVPISIYAQPCNFQNPGML